MPRMVPRPLLIAIAGAPAAGKTTLAEFLSRQFGYKLFRRSTPAKALQLEPGWDRVLGERNLTSTYVIDSANGSADLEYLRDRFDKQLRVIWIAAPQSVREKRAASSTGTMTEATGSPPVAMEEFVSAVIQNIDLEDAITQLVPLVLRWTTDGGRRPTTLREMLSAVTRFHRKHGYDIGTGDQQVMYFRMGLLVEELGEVNECLSKGKGDICEEHADLLILILGNAITLGLDIERGFWKKYERIMKRKGRRVGANLRVSKWAGESSELTDREGYYPLTARDLLEGDREVGDEPGKSIPADVQLMLFKWED